MEDEISLEDLLCRLAPRGEPMVLSQLDGFLAGLAILPTRLDHTVWIPVVWGGDGGDHLPRLSLAETDRLVHQILRHRERVETAIAERCYLPILAEDGRAGEVLFEFWAEGFGQAIDLCPDAFSRLERSEEGEMQDAAAALGRLVALCRGRDGAECTPNDEERAALEAAPAELIAYWIDVLGRRRETMDE